MKPSDEPINTRCACIQLACNGYVGARCLSGVYKYDVVSKLLFVRLRLIITEAQHVGTFLSVVV